MIDQPASGDDRLLLLALAADAETARPGCATAKALRMLAAHPHLTDAGIKQWIRWARTVASISLNWAEVIAQAVLDGEAQRRKHPPATTPEGARPG